ncbi:MAG: AtpZ/AtpI family protein [bacterium]|nr:AtpZ/AtpI family protein [bacterium]
MTGDQQPPQAPGRRELPEPPDPARVEDLRRRLRRDRRERDAGPVGVPLPGVRSGEEAGRRARDIGIYTIIPMMMIVGPAIGYLLGLGAERVFGGKPWLSLAGMLWGMLAAFRQVYLILKERGEKPRRPDQP